MSLYFVSLLCLLKKRCHKNGEKKINSIFKKMKMEKKITL